ncbi:hypothetical protein I5L45_23145 [Serratia marcescens]|uniref:hypothetical protein n=1 Tax=Serratia marcescens TaxID=615 RepID=UPI0018D5B9D7|nr:hypothetical protein [Serratia marcescens]
MDLKIQFVLFCITCKPRRPTAGQRPGKSIALAVKIIINLSFSATIFYLFALRKVLPLTYFNKGNGNEKNSARGIRLYGMGAVEFRRQECERLIGRLFPADAVGRLK